MDNTELMKEAGAAWEAWRAVNNPTVTHEGLIGLARAAFINGYIAAALKREAVSA